MLSLTDLKVGIKIIVDGDPCVVIFSEHSKLGRGGAIMRTRLKNLITGATIPRTFQGSEKFNKAELEKKSATFLYYNGQNSYFMDNENYEQFELPNSHLGESLGYLAENSPVEILYFQNPSTPLGTSKPINIDLPIKMTFRVISAPPNVKGNSAGSVTKLATINTGKQIAVPLFVKEGDKIVVDTRTGSYVERTN